jgi:hypothetical protein
MEKRDPEGCRLYVGHRVLQATRRFYLAQTLEDQKRAAKWVLAWALREKAAADMKRGGSRSLHG